MKNRFVAKVRTYAVILMFGAGGIASCADGSGQQVGSFAGAVIGGLVGSQIGDGSGKVAATMLGTFAGAYFGGKIAEALTEEDHEQMAGATEDALNSPDEYAQAKWLNEDSGNAGSVTASEAYAQNTDGDDEVCREFTQSVTLADGTKDVAKGIACQQADGSWAFKS